MYSRVIEAQYPLEFRKQESLLLGKHLRHRHSITMIGMKRVGISNFLRFFFSHADMRDTYIRDKGKHVFIVVDLNDLIEREIFPFWTLVLKRVADTVEKIDMSSKEKKNIEILFLKSIQLQDHFMTLDNVRQALLVLIENNFIPTVFFVHFDRIRDKVSPTFFDNLEGLLDATGNKLSYVFTSFRSLNELSPEVFFNNPLPFYCESMHVGPAEKKDMETVFSAYNNRYSLNLSDKLKHALFDFAGGHIQYLQLSLLALGEYEKIKSSTPEDLLDLLLKDERIILQSEELLESLTETEREVLLKIANGDKLSEDDYKEASYLWDSQIVIAQQGKASVFGKFFQEYLKRAVVKQPVLQNSAHFTRKENALFKFLKDHINLICERDMIINSVWPEYTEAGISDWAIDRLVARLRTKLRSQKSKFEIKTIRTRGYQLVDK